MLSIDEAIEHAIENVREECEYINDIEGYDN